MISPAIATATATSSSNFHHDRAWWAAEAARNGTDWAGVFETHLAVLAMLGLIELAPSTFEIACEEADRKRGRRSRR
jgi:hypothetical protein